MSITYCSHCPWSIETGHVQCADCKRQSAIDELEARKTALKADAKKREAERKSHKGRILGVFDAIREGRTPNITYEMLPPPPGDASPRPSHLRRIK